MAKRKEAALMKLEMNALDALVGKTKPGVILAPDVVKAARNKSHPLHRRFEWDVSKAAHSHWLEQARDIVQIYVTVISVDSAPVHAYVSLSTATGRDGYMPIRKALGSADTLAELRRMFARDLRAVLERHAYLRGKLAREFAAVEKVAEKVGGE